MQISDIYLVPLLLGAILSLRSFGQKWAIQYRLFSMLLISDFLVEVITIFIIHRNSWVYNIYLIPEYLLYMSVFYYELRSTLIRRIISYMGFIFGGLAIFNYMFIQKPYFFNNYTFVLADVIMVALSILYFNQVFRQKEMVKLSNEPMFWISAGVLIFHSGILPFFLSYNLISPSLLTKLIYILLIMNFIRYSFYTIAFLCKTRHRK